MPEGHIQARVTPQSFGESMTFITPRAEIRVLGTELEFLSLAGQTDVVVCEGKVRGTRASDGRTSEVGTAQCLTVTDSGDLAASETRSVEKSPEQPYQRTAGLISQRRGDAE